MALADYKNKKGLLASIIGVFCDCEYITDDDGFDSKLNFRLPFYTLLGTVFIGSCIGVEQIEQFHFVSIGTNRVAPSKVLRNK